MKPGPPPRPTKIEEFMGKPGHRNRNRNEVEPDPAAPSQPKWLSREAKREWTRQIKGMEETGLITSVDRAALAVYCSLWDTVVTAQKMVNDPKIGRTYEGDKGQQCITSWHKILTTAMKDMLRYAHEFGFTPSSRVRVDGGEATPGDKAYAAMQKRLHG